MIPLTIQLKNFLSYGSDIQTVDFSPYSLICLSGKNGHGKSALLDAITWAVWGQARKISGAVKADQGLLRLGQTQMMVVFTFMCNGQTYRIKREYAKTYGKPYAALDFGILDISDEKEQFISLRGTTIRATQAIIEQTLHLDYESFINSAFLRQGQANEFSKKSPKERKEILASILDLDQYESIRKKATEKIKQAHEQMLQVNALQEKISTELEDSAPVMALLNDVKKQLHDIAKKEKKLQEIKERIQKEKKDHVQEQQALHVNRLQLENLKSKELDEQKRLRHLIAEWHSIHKKQLSFSDYEIVEAKKKQAMDDVKTNQLIFQKNLDLKEQILKQKTEIQALVQQIEAEITKKINTKKIETERFILEKRHFEDKKNDAQENYDQQQELLKTIEAEQKKISAQKQDIHNLINNFKELEKQFEKRKNFYQAMITQGNLLRNEIVNLEHKKQLSEDNENPSCSLCEQNLSASRKRFLKQKFSKDEHFLNHRLARITKIIPRIKSILLEQHEKLNDIKKTIDEQTEYQKITEENNKKEQTIRNNAQEIKQHIDQITCEIQTKNDKIKSKEKEYKLLLDSTQQSFQENESYVTEQQKLRELEQKISDLGYNSEKHQKAQQQLQSLEEQSVEYTKIKQQIMLQEERKKDICSLCIILKKRKKEKKSLEKENEKYKKVEEQEANVIKKEKQFEESVAHLNKQKEALLQEKGSLENQNKKQEQLEREYKEQQKKTVELNEIIDDHRMIALATSKDGIQALLIEEAIPEIEQEANELLAKLTENQAQIFIESLRDLKKGGTKETLDIKISDSLGIREYELFSGGEAFRIDFALRIAISKLLARRSGTSLQTLIIDEGFGSQDEDGLSYITDALRKIQNDFSKIIVVSHLSSMKDQFPVHFFVEKNPNGSKIQIIEQA